MSDMCRICGKTNLNIKHLFEEQHKIYIYQIELITGEWLSDEEGWPSYICIRCEEDLRVAVTFRRRCIKTQQKLRQEHVTAKVRPGHWDPLNFKQESELEIDEELTDLESISDTLRDSESVLDKEVNNEDSLVLSDFSDAIDKLNAMQKREMEQVVESSEDEFVNLTDKSQDAIVQEKRIVSKRRINLSPPTLKTTAKKKRRNRGDYICEHCGRHFNDKTNLNQHLLRHTGVRNFECSICKKRFYTLGMLTQHKYIHTGVRRYSCRYCDMKFKSSGHRIVHERSVHTFERPFKCRFCEMVFKTTAQQKNHEAVHSDVRNYHCELCDTSFKTSKALKEHNLSKKHKKNLNNANNDQS